MQITSTEVTLNAKSDGHYRSVARNGQKAIRPGTKSHGCRLWPSNETAYWIGASTTRRSLERSRSVHDPTNDTNIAATSDWVGRYSSMRRNRLGQYGILRLYRVWSHRELHASRGSFCGAARQSSSSGQACQKMWQGLPRFWLRAEPIASRPAPSTTMLGVDR